MTFDVESIYNRIVDGVVGRTCPPSVGENARLLRRATIKKLLLYKALGHRVDGLSGEMEALAKSGEGGHILDRFIHNLDLLNHLNGPEHNLFRMSEEQLRHYGTLDGGLRDRFAEMHAKDPTRFEEFLRSSVEEVTQGLQSHEAVAAPSALGKVARGSAVLAGVGLLGHGAYKASAATETDEHGRTRRNWAKTLGYATEAAAGAGLTWAALAHRGPTVGVPHR